MARGWKGERSGGRKKVSKQQVKQLFKSVSESKPRAWSMNAIRLYQQKPPCQRTYRQIMTHGLTGHCMPLTLGNSECLIKFEHMTT